MSESKFGPVRATSLALVGKGRGGRADSGTYRAGRRSGLLINAAVAMHESALQQTLPLFAQASRQIGSGQCSAS